MKRSEQAGSRLRVLKVWYLQELILLFREPVAVFFSLGFPLIMYLFIGVPNAEIPILGTSARFIDVMFPSLVGMAVANLLLIGLPIYVSALRAEQIDKRYRALPLSGANLGAAIMLAMLTLNLLASSIVVSVIGVVNGLRLEVIDPKFLLLNFGFLIFLCGFGFFLGTLPLGTRAIQALATGIFFILFFGSGAVGPLNTLPKIVQNILEWNPLKIWFDALVAVYINVDFPSGGVWKILLTLAFSFSLGLFGLINWRRTE